MALQDNYIAAKTHAFTPRGVVYLAQTFTAAQSYTIDSIELLLYRGAGDSPGDCIFQLTGVTGDSPPKPDLTNVLATATVSLNGVTTNTNGEYYTVTFAATYNIVGSSVYALVLKAPDANTGDINWLVSSVAGYPNGNVAEYSGSWTDYVGFDGMFKTYSVDWPIGTIAGSAGQSGALSFYRTGLVGTIAGNAGQSGNLTFPVLSLAGTIAATGAVSGYLLYGNILSKANIQTFKKLVACGNDLLEYENMAGSMTALAGSVNDIDTSDQLMIFEGYQKVFVINGSNLKVADFVNTKIVDANTFTTKPTKGQLVYQNGSDPAVMVVDFINGDDDTMYGFVISGTFEVTTAITSTVGGAGNVIFPSPAAPVSNPHWYDWTPYNNDTSTYGTMPNKAYIGCLYRGRGVLSGDPEHPNQWYMSRQNHLFDFNFASNDVQTAVAGSNADAGELGDIVRALIPFKDDYLIIGCASQIWYMAGDPAAGGSLNELDLTTGIYGPQSWCIDNAGNLYFWGTNGLYKTTVPGVPENISRAKLPKLVTDEGVNPATHRITLVYDRVRTGIIICITLMSDGTSSNYFYDLTTGGFFPESYPTECGVYSAFYYAANDSDYSGLLVGSKDGYIRTFSDSDKSDVLGDDSASSINAYCTWGPIKLARGDDLYGIVNALEIITAGGASGGSQSDSNDVSYNIFVANTAEEILEKLSANTDYRVTGTVIAPGRPKGSRIRKRFRAMYLGLRLWNSTVAETWSVNKIIGNIKAGGKFR
ncbi:hypothetical protein LCGC14_0536160 [marine sediment metagenome]|uniref:Uncharacterized protein n=1 Tax=marine sediment metagenome TaxID=412755 RepID=A0A0F9RYT2_9ZZZZ